MGCNITSEPQIASDTSPLGAYITRDIGLQGTHTRGEGGGRVAISLLHRYWVHNEWHVTWVYQIQIRLSCHDRSQILTTHHVVIVQDVKQKQLPRRRSLMTGLSKLGWCWERCGSQTAPLNRPASSEWVHELYINNVSILSVTSQLSPANCHQHQWVQTWKPIPGKLLVDYSPPTTNLLITVMRYVQVRVSCE